MTRAAAALVLSALALGAIAVADGLAAQLRGGQLFVSARNLDLLRPPILQRLKNGSAVSFDFHLGLWAGSRPSLRRRSFERFVVSYDLWEEKFAVTSLRSPALSATGLSAESVPAWCLQNIAIPWPRLQEREPIWVRLEVKTADPREDSGLMGGAGLNVNKLVEWLSRPAGPGGERWSLESGPLSVAEVRR